jgi:hypothetical protein
MDRVRVGRKFEVSSAASDHLATNAVPDALGASGGAPAFRSRTEPPPFQILSPSFLMGTFGRMYGLRLGRRRWLRLDIALALALLTDVEETSRSTASAVAQADG